MITRSPSRPPFTWTANVTAVVRGSPRSDLRVMRVPIITRVWHVRGTMVQAFTLARGLLIPWRCLVRLSLDKTDHLVDMVRDLVASARSRSEGSARYPERVAGSFASSWSRVGINVDPRLMLRRERDDGRADSLLLVM